MGSYEMDGTESHVQAHAPEDVLQIGRGLWDLTVASSKRPKIATVAASTGHLGHVSGAVAALADNPT
jgi:hypothetical protein